MIIIKNKEDPQKQNRGGYRKNAGKPKLYDSEMRTITFRIPVKSEDEVRSSVREILEKYKIKKTKP